MLNFFKQKTLYLTAIVVLLVIIVLGLAQLGSTVNPVPKNLPVLLVQLDEGAKSPAGGDLQFGKALAERITASEGADGSSSKLPLIWSVKPSEQAAIDAMNHQEAYGALIIPADFSGKLASLLSPMPQPASVTVYLNQGMNYNGATITGQILTQILNGTNVQVREQLLANADKQGGLLSVQQTKALATPIGVTTQTINAVGTSSSNGNAPVVLTQLVWFGAMVSTLMLFVTSKKATVNGRRLHRLGIRAAQIMMGAVATGIVSLSILWVAGSWFGLAIPDYMAVGLYLFFVGFVFFLLQTTVVSWLGFAGMPLFILVFFFGAPVLTVPPQLLPQFSHDYLYSWLPLRFSAEGLRDLFYFHGHHNLVAPSITLAVIGGVSIVLILLSVFKKHATDTPSQAVETAQY